jgi:DNA-binding transcriptional regulator PaaX
MEKRIKIGKNMEKILVLLLSGITIGLSRSPRKTQLILKNIPKEFQKIDKKYLNKAIRRLYQNKMIDFKDNEDGTQTIVLTEEGRKKALTFNIDNLKLKNEEKWDGYWRLVIFDIPEKFKRERDKISSIIKSAGAYPLQKSVFIYPYNCKDEIDFVIEFFGLRRFVRFALVKHIDNELHLKKIFKLINR